MVRWVTINLPWSRNRKVEASVARKRRRVARLYEQAFDKAEQTLGQTLREAVAALIAVRMANLKRCCPEQIEGESAYTDDLSRVKQRYPLLDVQLSTDSPDVCDAAWLAEVKWEAKRSPLAMALGEFYHYRYQRWLLSGQTKEYQEAKQYEQEIQVMIQNGVFHGAMVNHPLCRPGVVLEVKRHTTGEVRQLLIGHLGVHGGPDQLEVGPQVIEEDDIVIRAQVVWEERVR